jgi:adenylate kinase
MRCLVFKLAIIVGIAGVGKSTVLKKRIASSKSSLKVVDTHFQIPTPFGYLPGIPMHVAKILKPTHLFLITAPAEIIIKRRLNDPKRESLKQQQKSL